MVVDITYRVERSDDLCRTKVRPEGIALATNVCKCNHCALAEPLHLSKIHNSYMNLISTTTIQTLA